MRERLQAVAKGVPRIASRLPGGISRRTAAAGAIALAVVVLAALVISATGDDGRAGAQAGGEPTMELERRELAETVSVDGTLGYEDEAEVINRLSGTVTWLPEEGSVIRRGDRLFEIDNEEVVLLYGDIPAYRTLSSGVEGADVKQLEANLQELGYDADGSMTVDGEFTSATFEAVSDWQDARGVSQTGEISLGEVIFQPGARRVSSLEIALGADAGSSGGTGSATGASRQAVSGAATVLVASSTETGLAEAEEDDYKDEGTKRPADDGKKPADEDETPAADDTKPDGDARGQGGVDDDGASQAQTPSSGSASGTGSSSAESQTTESSVPSTQVMTTTSTRRVVTLELDPNQISVAKRGAAVKVALPDGEEVKGRIAVVGSVAQTSSSGTGGTQTEEESSEDATIEVTVTLAGGAGSTSLDQAPVTVELTEDVRKDVFAVPVAALIGTTGGGYAIVLSEDGETRQIAVEPGMFADGYVEVEGEGLQEGLPVEVPEE